MRQIKPSIQAHMNRHLFVCRGNPLSPLSLLCSVFNLLLAGRSQFTFSPGCSTPQHLSQSSKQSQIAVVVQGPGLPANTPAKADFCTGMRNTSKRRAAGVQLSRPWLVTRLTFSASISQ